LVIAQLITAASARLGGKAIRRLVSESEKFDDVSSSLSVESSGSGYNQTYSFGL
jgi:hypothetical protein